MVERDIRERYFRLLKGYVVSQDEKYLLEAFELGREMLLTGVPEEGVAEINEEATGRLAQEFPEMTLQDAATSVSIPLMEVLMTYSQAFRTEIEERKRAEEALQKANDELEAKVGERTKELEEANTRLIEASQLKSRFLSNMSHELRTPLNSIIGYTGILLQEIVGELNDEQKRELKMVSESGQDLLRLINDILDLSKIEAGKIEIIPTQFDVRELVQMVEKMVLPLVEEKGLTIHVLISEDVPPVVYNDKNRIKQVLVNLLSNATKFTESGEIHLTVNAELEKKESEIRIPQSDIPQSAFPNPKSYSA